MRPLTLKFKGLRTYRAEQEIDFTDVRLMAIIGDTGAGKSSILEALCFALYGGPTWNTKAAKSLIADGGDGTVRAELTFQANGKTWRVTRTTSAKPYPPANHHLTCLDDDTPDLDTAHAVNAQIENLVGLDYPAFLKAVVLPQGRFQDLLRANEADRTPILKAALGLEQITEIRDRARAKYDQLLPGLINLQQQRSSLIPDPDRVIHETTCALSKLAEEITALNHAGKKHAEALTVHTEATRRASEFRSTATQLDDKVPNAMTEQYQQLIELGSQLAAELSAIEEQSTEAAAHEEQLQTVLDDAQRDGIGTSDAAALLATLRSLLDQLPQIQSDHVRLHTQAAAIEAERAQLEDRKHVHAVLAHQSQQAESLATRTDSDLLNATKTLQLQRSLLRDVRVAAQNTAAASTHECTTRRAVQRNAEALTDARHASARADEHVDHAEGILAAANRKNSAAHAAAHHGPGDPCPVCVRPLPNDFQALMATDIAEAKLEVTKAKQRAKTAAQKLTTAEAAHSTTQANLATAVTATETTVNEYNTAIEALGAVLESIDLDKPDDTLLAATQYTVHEAETAKKQAQDAAKAALVAQTQDKAEITSTETGLTNRQQELAKSLKALDRRRTAALRSYDRVPTRYRISDDLSDTSINHAIGLLEPHQRRLTDTEATLKSAREHSKRLRDTKDTLTASIHNKIDKPATRLARTIHALADRAETTTHLTNPIPLPHRPEPPTVTTDAQWAREVTAAVRQIIQGCNTAAAAHDEIAINARTSMTSALADIDVNSREQLTEQLVDTRARVLKAQESQTKARTDKPLRAEFDRRITGIEPAIESLKELTALLSDGKFMAAAVKRRQRALLGIASGVLADMTHDRFAFSDDFRIIDNHTGQPRHVKTLSGGETFLASLALALALVELTSRGGGRIEALFLDEGFGSLDANALNEAMEALTRQAASGRLVAVITHMRSVAENFDNILVVGKSLGGSQAHWATPGERDTMITDGLTGGLLE
ncbi:SMC family ATPase [Nocardia sp. NBC_00565]|uniref:SMC family ATPase n=1 Tax=Nocardia sp. NBC_00565 TaxID=2975993 RepID=UPI002E80D0B9|nr:SMC family ATPase [Nocardia sp. NBC_00565]WUC02011.1 SMC family ATPase [Nocardia sp. NBC_00565]